MAKTIYRIGKDIYDAGSNQRIADPATLQRDYVGATDLGQKPAGFTAINGAKFNTKEAQQANFNDIQPIGNTLYGVPKTPTSTDIKTGIDLAGIKPPEPVFNSVYDVYTQGATKTSEQMNNDLMKWYEQEKTKKDAEIAQLKAEQEANNKLREENLRNASQIGQKSVDELAANNPMLADYTSSINMKDYYSELDTQYKERKAAADEYAQTVKMMNEDLLAEKNRSTLKMFSLAKQNNLKENYVAQLSMLEARINNADGNYAMAAKTLDRGISLIQTARQDLLNSYDYIDQIYKMKDEKTGEALLNATNDQKSYVTAQIKMIEDKIAQTEADKTNIISLLTNSDTAQIANSAGVTIIDTKEQAMEKISNYYKKNPSVFTDVNAELKNILLQKEIEQYGQTTEYKNYQLAGGLEGTGLDFDTWLKSGDKNKTLTDAQLKVKTYADRMANSDTIITKLESVGQNLWGVLTGNDKYPNIFKTSDRQSYEQAMRDFVNATLRQESGAAIAETEFQSAKKQYFPQPGDSDAVIVQKRKNRQLAIDGMMRQAGSNNSSSDSGGEWNW